MDPIHPIRPTAVNPAAVDAARRVARDPDKDREREQQRPRPPRKPVAQPAADDGTPLAHVDERV
jgi:hypothetical protein